LGLTCNKSRGAFATYWDNLKPDLNSKAASGWNVSNLFPAEENLAIAISGKVLKNSIKEGAS
jgi:hypothetical protein